MHEQLYNEVTFLPGVGPKKAQVLFDEAQIHTWKDLLYYFPFRYSDRTSFYTINELKQGMPFIQVKGKFRQFTIQGAGRKKRLTAIFSDETGNLELIWFKGYKYIQERISTKETYVIYGKPALFNRTFSISHPEVESLADREKKTFSHGLQPVYPTTERMKNGYINSNAVQKIVGTMLQKLSMKVPETLPADLIQQANLMHLHETLITLHFPKNSDELRAATFRAKFEELFYIQLNILRYREARIQKFKGFVFTKVGSFTNKFYKEILPFELTNAQKKVIREIRKDLGSGTQMNRLLQGDVGSGKTLVAIMCALIALDNGYQACLMAPTEILATQHYIGISEMLEPLGLNVHLLTGSVKKKNREQIHADLLSGANHLLIGTHALIEDTVQFKNLGLVIIDEQHRFGVAQRARLWKKNIQPPHVLVMTATPIPRTLAMTVYGDLDVSIIDELPPGRKPIQTHHYYENKREALYRFLKDELDLGRQVYVVYPLIKESEKLDYQNLEDGYEYICGHFPNEKYKKCMVHGQMKPAEKEAAMQSFVSGETQIMVATTVIEVGVNVPNASVMVIESSERFGLSQLHQLRGRVGRGADQSYCILMSSRKLSEESRKRLGIMTETNDGFEIAEADLKFRGPGDLEGTQQSGIPFTLKLASLTKDSELLRYAREVATAVLKEDPTLSLPKNVMLAKYLRTIKTGMDWSSIS